MAPNCTSSGSIVVGALLCFLTLGSATGLSKAFLGGGGGPAMSLEDLHRELVQADRGTLDSIERVLVPMYSTLPKNAQGKLDHATVCYALHRYFVQQYGWFIKGMGPDGSGWNGSSSTAAMREGTPAHVQRLLEHHLGSRGLDRRELAALASVVHSVVSQQYLGRPEYAYRLAGAPIEGRATYEQFTKAITMWMAMLIIGPDLPSVTSQHIITASRKMSDYFPSWDDLLFWVEDVRQSVAYTQRGRRNPFVDGALPLEAMGAVVSEVPKQFGRWHDSLCMGMKATLVGLGSNGRVGLAEFFGGENHGLDWHFAESVDYLRQLGALDESDPRRLRVIVPNYLIGPNNCMEASPMHTYCCKDECGKIMAEVERGIAAPAGVPEEIAKIVSQISSDTVDAPRNLTAELVGKLEAVASRHGGRVPVHGRLFAQWMHHAFPNECPHPHLSGTTAPKTAAEFQKSGGNADVTDEERAQHIAAQSLLPRSDASEIDLSWSDEEELLSYDESNSPALWSAGIFYCMIAALFAVTLGGARLCSVALGGEKRAVKVSLKYSV